MTSLRAYAKQSSFYLYSTEEGMLDRHACLREAEEAALWRSQVARLR